MWLSLYNRAELPLTVQVEPHEISHLRENRSMSQIFRKIFYPETFASLFSCGFKLVIVGMMITYFGCAPLKPVHIPEERALKPADSEFWDAIAHERSGNWFKLLNTGDEALEW